MWDARKEKRPSPTVKQYAFQEKAGLWQREQAFSEYLLCARHRIRYFLFRPSSPILTVPLQGSYYYFHFTNEKTAS